MIIIVYLVFDLTLIMMKYIIKMVSCTLDEHKKKVNNNMHAAWVCYKSIMHHPAPRRVSPAAGKVKAGMAPVPRL